ncbi:MAG: S1 RNA-binding domain-containing protein, partial [Campylobacteraceae bacterium]|nr:S1 RNA-binding domain-containing protein [Campylobacteraceae bacterium]
MVKEVNNNVQNGVDTQNFTEEMDFAKMLEESFRETGEEVLIDGVIVDIKDDVTLIDVGRKSEGRLYTSEIMSKDGKPMYKVGDTIKVVITGSRNEKPMVSHKKALKKEKVKDFINNYNKDEELLLDVKIVGKNKGGLIAESKDGIEFFIPRSQTAAKDMQSLVGKTTKVLVIKIDDENQSIVASRKKVLDHENKKRKEIIDKLLGSDDIKNGKVKKITTYGMFVDVGGIDGLVHYSEISYKGPVNPGS